LYGVFGTGNSKMQHAFLCPGEGPPLYELYAVNHTVSNADDVLSSVDILQSNKDLVDAVEETQMAQKSYGIIKSETGYGKWMNE